MRSFIIVDAARQIRSKTSLGALTTATSLKVFQPLRIIGVSSNGSAFKRCCQAKRSEWENQKKLCTGCFIFANNISNLKCKIVLHASLRYKGPSFSGTAFTDVYLLKSNLKSGSLLNIGVRSRGIMEGTPSKFRAFLFLGQVAYRRREKCWTN